MLRNEDLDRARCKSQFVNAMYEDLRWFGFEYDEGPDFGGFYAPYVQSERRQWYVAAFQELRAGGFIYPCTCSRQDVLRSVQAPHAGEEEPLYPGTCRGKSIGAEPAGREQAVASSSARINWRFRVPDGEVISFVDGYYGSQKFTAGVDFGDFVVWRHDDIPAYQLAVVVDDASMAISEVVRGADLLTSTARQLLLYGALGWKPPCFYHCPLMTDETGTRLAKRHEAQSLRTLREQGKSPEQLRSGWDAMAITANAPGNTVSN